MTTTAAIKERPILFSGEMVQAILAGRKTQTRRVLKPQPQVASNNDASWRDAKSALWRNAKQYARDCCPYGAPGDRLWVRETWNYYRDRTEEEQAKQDEILKAFNDGTVTDISEMAMSIPVGTGEKKAVYAADFGDYIQDRDCDMHWKPSIFMPRSASRITLEVTDVRVERVQSISEADAIAEGVESCVVSEQDIADIQISDDNPQLKQLAKAFGPGEFTAKFEYAMLRDKINEKRGFGWAVNPWVWVVSFKRTEATA